MALIAHYLLDTSAAARMRLPAVAARLAPSIEAGLTATCTTLDAEALYGARCAAEYEDQRADRRYAYDCLPTGDWQAAFVAQRDLARTGRHRPVGIVDLLTAVLASQHRLPTCTPTPTSTSRAMSSTSERASG